MTRKKDFRLFFLLILPFLEPQIFKTVNKLEIIDSFFAAFKSICSVIIIILYFKKFNLHFSKPIKLMFSIQIITLISTIYNHGSVIRFIGPALISITIIMLGELVIKNDWKRYLIYLENTLTVFFIINTVTLSLKFLKIEPFFSWDSFLGIVNRWIYFFLPWVIIAFLNSYIKYGYINSHSWRIWFFATSYLVIAKSIGASLALSAFFIAFIIREINNGHTIFVTKAKTMYLVMIIMNILLIFGFSLNLFAPIIIGIFKKSITLSGRTLLWEVVLDVLSKKPFLGMGVQSHIFDMNYFYVQTNFCEPCRVNHPHNHFLNVAYHGGILSLIIFAYLVYYIMRQLDRIKKRVLVNILYCGSLAIFVCALADTLDFSLFYFFIPFISYFSQNNFNMEEVKFLPIKRKPLAK